MHFLLSDDGGRLGSTLRRALERGGHVVQLAVDPDEARYLAGAFEWDAFAITCAIPGEARTRVAALASARCAVPAVVVVDAATPADICVLLDHGARDVVAGCRGPRRAVARLIAAARRGHGHANSRLSAGLLELHLGTHDCFVGARAVTLTPMEFRLVEALMLRKGRLVSRVRLLELMYGSTSEPFAKSIDLFVHNIRDKLTAARAGNLLETWGKAFVMRDGTEAAIA